MGIPPRAGHCAEAGLKNLRIFGSPAKQAAPSGQPVSLCAESLGLPSGAAAAVVPERGGPRGQAQSQEAALREWQALQRRACGQR